MGAIQTIRDWLLDSNTCFLLGAGCGICAGLPALSQLTEDIEQEISQESFDIFKNLNCRNTKKPNIEDLINYLIREKTQLESLKTTAIKEEEIKRINEDIKKIKNKIHKSIGKMGIDLKKHKEFLENLNIQKSRRVCDIFSLNWDTILEFSLESLQIPYTDGFYGSENAFFKPELYELSNNYDFYFRIFKLHGSINWKRDENDAVRRVPISLLDGNSERMVIYPTEQKYILTQYGIYERLLDYFRKFLKEQVSNRKLVVIGYSFNDEHINLAIEDSIKSQENLSVYVFLGEEENSDEQIKRLRIIAERNYDRLNFLVGRKEFIGNGLINDALNTIKEKEVWKFESLVEIIKGELND